MPFARGAVVALIALTFQNTVLVILLKFSFREDAESYAPSTAILCTELLKLALCALAVSKQPGQFSATVQQLWAKKRLFLPAVLYVIQSNLLFFASKRLPPVIYIVCTQMKILTSAVFSRLLLGTTLSGSQYVSLFFLIFGIVLVQIDNFDFQEIHTVGESSAGFFAATLASLTSGLAGAVLEKLYKDPDACTRVKHTIWTRNLQLSLISIPFALSGVYLRAQEQVLKGNFFRGYDYVILSIICMQAAGGIITAYVLKFANVVSKCVAISMSICCCAIYSVWTGELIISTQIIVGVLVVNISVIAFSLSRVEIAPADSISDSHLLVSVGKASTFLFFS
jgi:UDP-sugar transporter A1/2/3